MSFVCHSYNLVYHPYLTWVSLVCTRMSSVCRSYILLCHPYVARIYLYVVRMSLVCNWSHPYVTHMYSYVTGMSIVCTRMSSVCHLYVVIPWTFLKCEYHWSNLLRRMFFTPSDNWKILFLYKFIVTQRFSTIAMLLRSFTQVFWKKSAFYIRYLHNNITMLLIPKVQNKTTS